MTPSSEVLDLLRPLRGCVGTVCTSGSIMPEFAASREDARVFNVEHGLKNIEYVTENAVLVEHGRDALVSHSLSPAGGPAYDWLLQIDADAVFSADAIFRILQTAYVTAPDADVVGGYAQLKNPPYLPTIDTGTGTWEPIFPGEGVVPVIRTGAHFLLTKTRVFSRFGPPWFRTRRSMRPIDALREVDNFARLKTSGRNPLDGDEWTRLLEKAKAEAGGAESAVGEDSGFADAVMAAGGKIVVDTDLVIGHLGKRLITPEMLKESLDARDAKVKAAVGVRT